MRKITQYLVVALIGAMLLPMTVVAHGDNSGSDNDDDRDGLKIFSNLRDRLENRLNHDDDNNRFSLHADLEHRAVVGTVTDTDDNSFTLKARNGIVYTVNTDSDTTFRLPFGGNFDEDDLKVNDGVKIKGTIEGTTIDASAVMVIPANMHPAKVKGTVTDIDEDTLTLETKNGNTVTVNTDSDTIVVDADGETAALSDIEVDSELKIKGLWDMVAEVFTAIKIRLF